MLSPDRSRTAILLRLLSVVPLGLLALDVSVWSSSPLRSAVTGLVISLLLLGALVVYGVQLRRQRLVVDGYRIWVRGVRWYGPIRMLEVVGMHWFPDRYGRSGFLVLVQREAGPHLGVRFAIRAFSLHARRLYRDTHPGRLRYVVISPWLSDPALRRFGPALLRHPGVIVDDRSRRVLGADARLAEHAR